MAQPSHGVELPLPRRAVVADNVVRHATRHRGGRGPPSRDQRHVTVADERSRPRADTQDSGYVGCARVWRRSPARSSPADSGVGTMSLAVSASRSPIVCGSDLHRGTVPAWPRSRVRADPAAPAADWSAPAPRSSAAACGEAATSRGASDPRVVDPGPAARRSTGGGLLMRRAHHEWCWLISRRRRDRTSRLGRAGVNVADGERDAVGESGIGGRCSCVTIMSSPQVEPIDAQSAFGLHAISSGTPPDGADVEHAGAASRAGGGDIRYDARVYAADARGSSGRSDPGGSRIPNIVLRVTVVWHGVDSWDLDIMSLLNTVFEMLVAMGCGQPSIGRIRTFPYRCRKLWPVCSGRSGSRGSAGRASRRRAAGPMTEAPVRDRRVRRRDGAWSKRYCP